MNGTQISLVLKLRLSLMCIYAVLHAVKCFAVC